MASSAKTPLSEETAERDTMVTPDVTQPLQELQITGNVQKTEEPGRAFSTPVTAARLSLNLPTKDMSPTSRRDLIHKTNEQIVQALNRRQMTESAVKKELASQLEHAKADSAKLSKMLCKTRSALVRSSMNSEVLSSAVPGAHMGELARRDQKIEHLEWEVGCLKAQLAAAEAGLQSRALRADGRDHGARPSASQEQRVSEGEEQEQRRRCEGELEGRSAALQALLDEKALLTHEQRERIDDLEAELENAQSAAWEQREMQQQLEAAVQEAQAKMSAQSRELSEMRQESESLKVSLEGAEDYIAELEERFMALGAAGKA